MEQIKIALLSGNRKINLHGVEIHLPSLKRDTQKNKERAAEREALKIIKILNS